MADVDERIEVVTELIIRSAPCGESESMEHHVACPKEVVLNLWQVALTCGCECHTEYEWSG